MRLCRAAITRGAFILQLPQGLGDRQPRGANGWEKTADDANDERGLHALYKQLRRHSEIEYDLAETLAVQGGRRKPVEYEVREQSAQRP